MCLLPHHIIAPVPETLLRYGAPPAPIATLQRSPVPSEPYDSLPGRSRTLRSGLRTPSGAHCRL